MTWWTHGRTWSRDALAQKYATRMRGEDDAAAFVIELDGREIGYAQWYPLKSSLPDGALSPTNQLLVRYRREDLAGIDLFIGEPELLGHGLGPTIVEAFLAQHILPTFSGVVVDPQSANARAVRAFEKSGFSRTDFSEDPKYLLMLRQRDCATRYCVTVSTTKSPAPTPSSPTPTPIKTFPVEAHDSARR